MPGHRRTQALLPTFPMWDICCPDSGPQHPCLLEPRPGWGECLEQRYKHNARGRSYHGIGRLSLEETLKAHGHPLWGSWLCLHTSRNESPRAQVCLALLSSALPSASEALVLGS